LQANDDTPPPHGQGWLLKRSDDGQDGLEIEWMKGLPAPMAVLELLACQCKKTCDPGSCSCIQNKMYCTEICKLQDCSNSDRDDDCTAIEPNDVEDCYSDEDEDDDMEDGEVTSIQPTVDKLLLNMADEEEVETTDVLDEF
jgi:hypothetical protein